MKTCPLCGAKAVDMASTCFECLYSFADHSLGTIPPKRTVEGVGEQQTPEVIETVGEVQGEMTREVQGDAVTELEAEATNEPVEVPQPNHLSPQDVSDIFVELWKRGTLEKRYLSHNGSLYVGSGPYNDVALTSRRVSKRALHIYRLGETIFAEALTDQMKIYLNGQELDGVVPLKTHDAISLDDIRLVLG